MSGKNLQIAKKQHNFSQKKVIFFFTVVFCLFTCTENELFY